MSDFKCPICGNRKKAGSLYCNSCNKYVKSGNALYGADNTIGVQRILKDGLCICKLCGKVYKGLSQHLWQAHNISPSTYKKKFKLECDLSLGTAKHTRKNNMTDAGKEKLRKNMEKARHMRVVHRQRLKNLGVKRHETHKITEEDRKRRRDAMVLINEKRKIAKNS